MPTLSYSLSPEENYAERNSLANRGHSVVLDRYRIEGALGAIVRRRVNPAIHQPGRSAGILQYELRR